MSDREFPPTEEATKIVRRACHRSLRRFFRPVPSWELEDAEQEAQLDIAEWRCTHGNEHVRRPRQWLGSVARNAATNHARAETIKRVDTPASDWLEQSPDFTTDQTRSRHRVADLLHLRRAVQRFMASLTPRERVIVLHLMAGRKQCEIAELLGVQAPAISKKVSKLKSRLKELMRGDEDGPDDDGGGKRARPQEFEKTARRATRSRAIPGNDGDVGPPERTSEGPMAACGDERIYQEILRAFFSTGGIQNVIFAREQRDGRQSLGQPIRAPQALARRMSEHIAAGLAGRSSNGSRGNSFFFHTGGNLRGKEHSTAHRMCTTNNGRDVQEQVHYLATLGMMRNEIASLLGLERIELDRLLETMSAEYLADSAGAWERILRLPAFARGWDEVPVVARDDADAMLARALLRLPGFSESEADEFDIPARASPRDAPPDVPSDDGPEMSRSPQTPALPSTVEPPSGPTVANRKIQMSTPLPTHTSRRTLDLLQARWQDSQRPSVVRVSDTALRVRVEWNGDADLSGTFEIRTDNGGWFADEYLAVPEHVNDLIQTGEPDTDDMSLRFDRSPACGQTPFAVSARPIIWTTGGSDEASDTYWVHGSQHDAKSHALTAEETAMGPSHDRGWTGTRNQLRSARILAGLGSHKPDGAAALRLPDPVVQTEYRRQQLKPTLALAQKLLQKPSERGGAPGLPGDGTAGHGSVIRTPADGTPVPDERSGPHRYR